MTAQATPEQMERAEKLYQEHRTTGWDGTDVPAAIVAAIIQSDHQQAELKAHAEALAEALDQAHAAIKEMFRYYDGGETRGSYDGKPERNQLRKAGYACPGPLTAYREYQKGRSDD